MTPCWHNRFSLVDVPCPREGTWRGTETALDGAAQRMYWCDKHKHPNDVPVAKDEP